MIKAARILSILYVVPLTIFALLSGAEGEGGIVSNFPNTIPWLLACAVIFIAWKHPAAGGWIFIFFAIASIFFFNTYREFIPFMFLTAPLAVIGLLFIEGAKTAAARK